MITKKQIQEIKNRLIKTYKPLEIYLFGSYAWGKPTEDSDLDLLVVVEKSNQKRYKRGIVGCRALRGMMIPKDILVYTKKEFEQKASDVTTLCHKVFEEGVKLYAQS